MSRTSLFGALKRQLNPGAQAGITRNQVIKGYRTILGREPESEEAVEGHLGRHADEHAFWRALIESEEFITLRRHGSADADVLRAIRETFYREAGFIEYEVSDETLDALLARIQVQWTRLGAEAPYWSVLTDEHYRVENIGDRVIEDFYATGAQAAALIPQFEQRAGIAPSRGVCLELGCGVGRITEHLSQMFDEVIAVDISPGNLALCRERLLSRDITNVRTVQLERLVDVQDLPEADFLYSFIVLQHNPPPIQRYLLDLLLGKLKPGGKALFQIPTDLENYTFVAEDYLRTEDLGMELHALPRAEVLRLMARHRLTVFDVVPDTFVGVYGSDTYFGGKAEAIEHFIGQDAEDLVRELYRLILKREPDAQGAVKVERLRAGISTVESLLAEFLNSEEYEQLKKAGRSTLLNDHTQYGELALMLNRWMTVATPDRWVVDIGARGRDRSNSYDLLRHFEWKGLLIEANPDLIAPITDDFVGVDFRLVHCAVSDFDGEAEFFIGVNDDVSSLSKEASAGWGPVSHTLKVPVRRLEGLLNEHAVPHDFSLLSIDIEGEDIKVLNDLVAGGRYRPRWVIIEASLDFTVKTLTDLPFSDAVREAYRIVAQTRANLILERADLMNTA